MSWTKAYKQSGASVIENFKFGCTITVVPVDWAKQHCASNWAVTGHGQHKRGHASTLRAAKAAALAVATIMGRR